VDSLRVFGFVSSGNSICVEQHSKTDEVNPQWKQCVQTAGSKVIYALSPQAKSKVERPYRWMQDRIASNIFPASKKLAKYYAMESIAIITIKSTQPHNKYLVFSFMNAIQTGQSLFRRFVIPKPYTHLDASFVYGKNAKPIAIAKSPSGIRKSLSPKSIVLKTLTYMSFRTQRFKTLALAFASGTQIISCLPLPIPTQPFPNSSFEL
jgi:hypothetical protein